MHIYQGDTILGSGPATGSIEAEFEPGMHLLVPVTELNDGSKHAGWPSGFFVKGNMYRDEMRKTAPKLLSTAASRRDWQNVQRYATMVNDSFDEGEPERVKVAEYMQAALEAANKEIDRLLARPNAKKLREAMGEWASFQNHHARLQEAFNTAAAAAWEKVKGGNARALLNFIEDWSPSPAA